MARPRKEIDKKQFEYLCSIMCTEEEIAGVFDCSIDTINRWCKRTYHLSFAETYKNTSASGRISLRRYQFRLAENNPAMAIWLGKQYLNQREPSIDVVQTVNQPIINVERPDDDEE